MAGKDYYQILGVLKDASDKEVQRAFRRLARKYHPDVNPGDGEAAERFKRINQAYQVLSDPKTRRRYDQNGQGWPFEGRFQERSGPFTWQFDSDPGFGGGIFDDILTGVLRGRGRHPFQGVFESRRSTHVEQPIEVGLEEAYHGSTRVIELLQDEPCPTCRGKGGPSLAGCPQCGGSGWVQRPRRLEVRVPPGVRTGSRIRVSPRRPGGGAVGGIETIYLVVTVRPHPRFRRKGDDLYTEVTVPLLDAILGGQAQIDTLSGRVSLNIPPATQNGRNFRLKGRGMPVLGGSGKGDLYARVKVVLPSDLTDEEAALFRRLKEVGESRGAE